jgi:hypothetical protein
MLMTLQEDRSTVELEPDEGEVVIRSLELLSTAHAGESAPEPDEVIDP